MKELIKLIRTIKKKKTKKKVEILFFLVQLYIVIL